jgi:hypothetical protein
MINTIKVSPYDNEMQFTGDTHIGPGNMGLDMEMIL